MTHHDPAYHVNALWPAPDVLIRGLLPWMVSRRWCPVSKVPGLADVRIAAAHELAPCVRTLVVEIGGEGPQVLRVQVPLVVDESEALATCGADAGFVTAGRAFLDGAQHPEFWRAWAVDSLTHVSGVFSAQDRGGCFVFERVVSGEQSNTSVILRIRGACCTPGVPKRLIAKVIRIVSAGPNPDVELPQALAESGWVGVPRPLAWSTIAWPPMPSPAPAPVSAPAQAMSEDAEQWTHAVVASSFIPDAQDGFTALCTLASPPPPGNEAAQRALAVEAAQAVGALTAQMHERLRTCMGEWPSTSGAQVAQGLRERAQWAFDQVGQQIAQAWPSGKENDEAAADGEGFAGDVNELLGRVEALYGEVAALSSLPGLIRIHGDYHLGQILYQPGKHQSGRWFVVDFEGEPLRPLAERVTPDLAVRDVAGMLRSFDYAAAVGTSVDPEWLPCVRRAFIDAYWKESGGPSASEDLLIRAFEVDKALYEAVYEAKTRPHWLPIPVRGLHALISGRADSNCDK